MENWNNAKEILPLPRIGDTTTSSLVEVMYIDGNDGKEKTDTDRYDFNEHIWQKYDVVIAWRNISCDYRKMIIAYMKHIVSREGTCFLPVNELSDFENEELKRILQET